MVDWEKYRRLIEELSKHLGEDMDELIRDSINCYINTSIDSAEEMLKMLYSAGAGEEVDNQMIPPLLNKIKKLVEAKSLVRRILEGEEYGCVMELDTDPEMDFPIPLRLYCTSPLGDCKAEGKLAGEIASIEMYPLIQYDNEYWDKHLHALISSKYVGRCGLTRVYIRSDGALVLIHSQVYYTGVHVVKFKKPITSYLPIEARKQVDETMKTLEKWRKKK
jgi:hypothetical protein